MYKLYKCCHWRFKGEHAYRFGYPSRIEGSRLVRMGRWNGDYTGGYIVDEREIELQ